jgi:hypothetical protein
MMELHVVSSPPCLAVEVEVVEVVAVLLLSVHMLEREKSLVGSKHEGLGKDDRQP